MVKEINRKMAHGVAWMVAAKFAERGIGVVSTLILARLLVPADFGLVAMAVAIVAILELMGAFGFDIALIQNQKAERRHYDTVWTFYVCFGVFYALCMIGLAYPASLFYDEPRLENVMYVMAASSLLHGVVNVAVVDFRKELNFRREFQFQIRRKVVGFVVTIALAFTFRSYWALVLGSVATNLAGVILSYVMIKYRPRISFSALREMSGFSGWMFLNSLLAFLTNRLPDLLIGRVLGAKPLGVYTISYELANMPTNELVAPINRAVLPGYAKLSGNAADLARGYLAVAGLIAFFALPAGFGISAVAPLLVQVVLGAKWLEAIPIIVLLASRGAFVALVTNVGAVFLAVGKPRLITGITVLSLLFLVPGLIGGLHWFGLEGAAYAYWLASAVQVPLSYIVVVKLLGLRGSDILRFLWRPLLAALSMYAAVALYAETFFDPARGSVEGLPHLLAAVALGAAVYFVAACVLWMLAGRPQGAEAQILHWLKNRFVKRADAATGT
jgi:lipopolysaccharide exporter